MLESIPLQQADLLGRCQSLVLAPDQPVDQQMRFAAVFYSFSLYAARFQEFELFF